MLKHVETDHKSEKESVEFEIKVTKSFTKPLSRIINEGIRIKKTETKAHY